MRILLIQLRRLGDLILTTPAIGAIREHQPEAQIVLAVAPECEPLLPALSGIQQTIITSRGLRDISAWIELRRHCFNGTIDLTRNDRSAWLTLLSAAPTRIVSDRVRHQSKLRARCYTEFVRCTMKEMHTIDYYLALLQPLGICRYADQPASMLGHAVNGFWRDVLRRHYQIAFVLAVGIVHDDDPFALTSLFFTRAQHARKNSGKPIVGQRR